MSEIETISHILKEAGACPEGIEWMEQQPSPKDAWLTCTNGDWMISAVSLLHIATPVQWDAIGESPPAEDGFPRADVVRKCIPWPQIEEDLRYLSSKPDWYLNRLPTKWCCRHNL